MAVIGPSAALLGGPWWQRALLIGASLALFMGASLVIPNPLMPPDVAMAHLWEVLPSNFLVGLVGTALWAARSPEG